jgi:threonine dehydrogenase-like Zn-dependent dehydrogenase
MPLRLVTTDGKQFVLREYDPKPLAPSEIRIQVTFASPKHGTEQHVISGSAFNAKKWDAEMRLFIPNPDAAPHVATERGVGNIVVGSVMECGAEATRFAVGDRVYGYAQIAETAQGPEKNWEKLDGLTEIGAVCTDPAHVAFVAVRDGNIRIGDSVAIFGLGAIGLLAVQIAKAGGAQRIVAIDPIPSRRAYALAHGATDAFDPMGAEINGDVGVAIKQATEKKGVDVSIETSGSGPALHEAIRCLRQCGTCVHVPWGPKNAAPLHLDEEFHINRPTIIGSQAVWGNADRDHPLWDMPRAVAAVTDLLRRDVITGEGLIDPILDFSQTPEKMGEAFSNPANAIKIGVRF